MSFKHIPKVYADRLASERIAKTRTHALDPELAALIRELGDDIDPADVQGERDDTA